MKYELWIDGIWQDTFTSPSRVGNAIDRWLFNHYHECNDKVNFEVRIIK